MDHLSEILKIIDGALRHNVRMSFDYAGLLAQKLEDGGHRDQARRIRERLSRAPLQSLSPQSSSLPVDQDSRLSTVDEYHPRKGDVEVVFSDGIAQRLGEFIGTINHFDELAAVGIATPPRLLIYGPPGCGKTLTAQWIASELGLPLLTARCDTLVSSLLGQTARNLRRVFEHVESRPCVLFLDEFDALAKSRADEREIGELQRVVIALLQNIDALPSSTILIAATNHEDLLDHAVWRRFAFKIAMPLPSEVLRKQLWKKRLGTYADENLNFQRLSEISDGFSGAAIEQCSQDALRSTVLARKSKVPETEVLRRVGLTIAMTKKIPLPQIEDEVRWLRDWLPKVFSQRTLAELYQVSLRQIRNMLRGNDNGSVEQSNLEGGI